jgi:hypothetical protein
MIGNRNSIIVVQFCFIKGYVPASDTCTSCLGYYLVLVKKNRYLTIQLPGVLQFLVSSNSFIRYVLDFTALGFLT